MANRYWIGDTGNWTDTAHWSATSGGSGGETVPTTSDDVIFDANSFSANGQTLTLNVSSAPAVCKSLDCTDASYPFTLVKTSSCYGIDCRGDFKLRSGLSFDLVGKTFNLRAGSPGTYTFETGDNFFDGIYIYMGGYTDDADLIIWQVVGNIYSASSNYGEIDFDCHVTLTNNIIETDDLEFYGANCDVNLGSSQLSTTSYTLFHGYLNSLDAGTSTLDLRLISDWNNVTYLGEHLLNNVTVSNITEDWYLRMRDSGSITTFTVEPGCLIYWDTGNTWTFTNFNAIGTNSKNITFSYASTPTSYVNPGLELISNGYFLGSATNWTLGTNWTYASDAVSKTSNNYANIEQIVNTSDGKWYQISIDITTTVAGTLSFGLFTGGIGQSGFGSITSAATTSGTYTVVGQCSGGAQRILIGPTFPNNWNGSVNSICLREVEPVYEYTFSKSSGRVECDYVNLYNSTATGGATWYAGLHSTDGGGNNGWLFRDYQLPTGIDENGISVLKGTIAGTTMKQIKVDEVTRRLAVEDSTTGSDNGPANTLRDENGRAALLATSSADGTPIAVYADANGNLLINSN